MQPLASRAQFLQPLLKKKIHYSGYCVDLTGRTRKRASDSSSLRMKRELEPEEGSFLLVLCSIFWLNSSPLSHGSGHPKPKAPRMWSWARRFHGLGAKGLVEFEPDPKAQCSCTAFVHTYIYIYI